MKALIVMITIVLLAYSAQAQTELTGFPISFTRTSGTPAYIHEHGPVVANFDDDESLEIIVLSDANNTGDGQSDRILVFDPESATPGTPEYTLDMPTGLRNLGYTFSHSPVVLDGDGDGNMEIAVCAWKASTFATGNCPIFGGSCRHTSTCLHYETAVLSYEFGSATPTIVSGSYNKLTTPSVGDVTGDGIEDLIFVGASFNGSESPRGGSAAFTMIRLQPNGTLDPTFATNGIQVTDLGPTYDYANAIFRLNGFIYLGGQADQLPGPGPGRLVVAFARYFGDPAGNPENYRLFLPIAVR